ncbi:hypothetical protein D6C84_03524 [Aureobasidium pullulans]|uniref:Uncharacterized protein n=1 Tax=Aureobasidium pullulans TaxID=5580 RepID=A0A4S9Y328_AURPU|nr:hypothetical protein D6C84_03524 [Aureobasidium pullulans]
MSSNGKRKATEDISSNEKRKATTSSTTDAANPTKSSLTHVYVVQSLDVDPYRPLEQDVRGVYTDLATANAAARSFYNKHSSWGPLAEVKRPKPEQPKMRSGRYRDMAEDEGEEDNDELGCVRLRHDGGLRFGMRDPEGTQYVVWVEKRELNPAKPSPTESEEYAASNSKAYGARHQLHEGGYASGGCGRTGYGSDEFGPQHGMDRYGF